MAYWRGNTTVLTKNSTWTSQVGMRERHDTIEGTVFSDVAGTVNVEQSSDGTNWDFNSTTAVTANTGASFSVKLVAPFWRLRYVNGGTDQATFRIQATTQGGGDS